MAPLTQQLARFIANARYEDLPPEATRFGTDAITDSIGVGLTGSREPVAEILLQTLSTSTAPSDHILLGSNRRAGATDAALYNGTMIHAIDYDDTAHPAYSHPSSHITPVLLAMGRDFRSTGRDLLLAYAIGVEIDNKLGHALNDSHCAKGWHPTGSFGAVSSAAVAAKLAGLDADRTNIAIGIAASAASGIRANFGSMVKPLHAGYSARNGVLAALLARNGFTAMPDSMESRIGYLAAFSGSEGVDYEAFANWGQPWEISTPIGLAIKPYPACGGAHTAIEAALAIRAELNGDPIVKVQVGANELWPHTLVYSNPTNPLEAKFSMQYCVAVALLRGEVTMQSFEPETFADPAIHEFMKRISVGIDDRVRHNSEHGTVVTAETKSGRVIERLVPMAHGKPEHWMTRDELWTKFRDCARVAVSESQARDLFDRLQNLASAPSLDSILATLDCADARVPAE